MTANYPAAGIFFVGLMGKTPLFSTAIRGTAWPIFKNILSIYRIFQ